MILLRFDPMGFRMIGIEIVISCFPFNRHNPARRMNPALSGIQILLGEPK
jgi:hypothetical protein